MGFIAKYGKSTFSPQFALPTPFTTTNTQILQASRDKLTQIESKTGVLFTTVNGIHDQVVNLSLPTANLVDIFANCAKMGQNQATSTSTSSSTTSPIPFSADLRENAQNIYIYTNLFVLMAKHYVKGMKQQQ